MNLRTVAAVAALLVVAACGGESSSSEPEDEPKGGPTTEWFSDTPSAEPVATVSVHTTCDELFLASGPRLWARAVDLVSKSSNDQMYLLAEADEVAAQLQETAAASKPQIRPHVQQMADAVDYLDGADVSTFKRSASELGNQCAPYAAAGGDYDATTN